MNDTLSICNPEPLRTATKTSLSIQVETQEVSPLYLVVPLGDQAAALMTRSQFESKLQVSVLPAQGSADKPDAILSSGYRTVDPKKPDRGRIALTRRNSGNRTRFCLYLKDFMTCAAAGSVDLLLEDKDQQRLAQVPVTIAGAEPRITKFVSTAYSVLSGNPVTFSWEISLSGNARLRRLPDEKDIPLRPGEKTAAVVAENSEHTSYRLDAMLGDRVTDSRVLTLFVYNQTQVKTYGGPGTDRDLGLSGVEILGIYNRRDRLYTVVRDSDARRGASIWWSDICFDPTSWKPLILLKNGQPVLQDGKSTPIMIPADAAARPAAVLGKRIYFMGGSSYDANCPGKEVGYFDIEANTWVDDQAHGVEAWPKDMPARMGHAVLASPDGNRLWVVGGYNGDGGALNDIWVYDKDAAKWTRQPAPGWEPRCLFGATFAGPERRELWVAGGFDNPGGYPTYDDIWHCDTSKPTLAWQKINYSLTEIPDNKRKQYCGCTLSALGDQVYAFTAYRDIDKGVTNNVISISFANTKWTPNRSLSVGNDWVYGTLDCYRFDATVLGGAIFVRQLARARKKDKNIHYLVCI